MKGKWLKLGLVAFGCSLSLLKISYDKVYRWLKQIPLWPKQKSIPTHQKYISHIGVIIESNIKRESFMCNWHSVKRMHPPCRYWWWALLYHKASLYYMLADECLLITKLSNTFTCMGWKNDCSIDWCTIYLCIYYSELTIKLN